MFKDDYKKKYDSIVPDPQFRRRLEERIEDMQNGKINRWMKRSATAVIVLGTMLALTTVGFATGAFQSIFSGMMNAFVNGPTVDYEHMEIVSNKGIAAQVVNFENGAQMEVKLDQSYYNGEQLALGWSSRPIGVRAEFLEKDDARVANCESGQWTINLEEKIGAEATAEFMRRVAQDGWAGVAWMDCYLSDHVCLADIPKKMGEDGYEHAPEDALFYPETNYRWKSDDTELIYEEYETPLPEAARNQEQVRIARKVTSQMCWMIVDGDRVYLGSDEAERKELSFEIQRSETYSNRSYRVERSFDQFSAAFELNVTPIKAEFSVNNLVSDEWKAIWGSYGGYLHAPLNLEADIVFDYEIYVDGVNVEVDKRSYEGVEGMTGWFLLPADAQTVTFRPVYANSGAHADEDVEISLTQTTK